MYCASLALGSVDRASAFTSGTAVQVTSRLGDSVLVDLNDCLNRARQAFSHAVALQDIAANAAMVPIWHDRLVVDLQSLFPHSGNAESSQAHAPRQ